MNSAFDATTCEAFIRTLPQLNEPLSDEVQHTIREILRAVANHQPKAADQIRDLVEHHGEIKAQYYAAYIKLQQQYQAQERAKAMGTLTLNDSTGLTLADLETLAARIFSADNNPIVAAREYVKPLKAPATIAPARSNFWERGDRVIAMTAGGAALGGAIGQIPGAIAGGILAAVFGWLTYTKPATKGTA
jgi:hypothetical protein